MATLTLRDVDDATLHRLRARAAAHRRSVSREPLDVLAVARLDALSARGAGAVAVTIRAAEALGVRTVSTSRDIVRSDRDRDGRARR